MSGAGALERPPRRRPVPLWQLLAASALLLVVLLATVLNRPDPGEIAARHGRRALSYVDLRFQDTSDGGVTVRRAEEEQVVAVLAPGTEGFIRATMRGLARDRRLRDLGPEAPFRLSAWPDGGLSLEDTATGRTLDLRAFGPTQAEAFGRLLPKRGEGAR